MSYRVQLAPAAERELRKLDPPARRRIQAAIDLLANDPRPPKAAWLVGRPIEWRVRTGAYRIIYEIHEDRLVVLVLRAGHRSTIYRRRG
jgi:mRNA interferase RelE/StbE